MSDDQEHPGPQHVAGILGQLAFPGLPTPAPASKGAKPRAPKPLTPADRKFADAVVEIQQDPDEYEYACLAREVIQCTLPHKDPGDVPRWLRRNGNFTLIVRPGWDDQGDRSLGYPYGSIPRLLLTYISTKAKLQYEIGEDPRLIELGPRLDAFMREIGLNPDNGTGKRSDARRLRAQADRLFQSNISFIRRTQRDDGAQGKQWSNMNVTEAGELWWDPKRPGQATLWGSKIYLGDRFSRALVAAPVSLDLRGVRAVKGSALEFDLYTWSVHKAFITNHKRASVFVPWEGLYWQIGTEYTRLRAFRAKATTAFVKIKHLFPGGGLRIEHVPAGPDQLAGIRIHPGTQLPIPPKAPARLRRSSASSTKSSAPK
jgi:hypothetical protein